MPVLNFWTAEYKEVVTANWPYIPRVGEHVVLLADQQDVRTVEDVTYVSDPEAESGCRVVVTISGKEAAVPFPPPTVDIL